MAVPIDPENAHRAVINGELTQPQRLLGSLTLAQCCAGIQQLTLQAAALQQQVADNRGQRQQDEAKKHTDAFPERQRVAQLARCQGKPARLQLLELTTGQRLQGALENIGKQRRIAATANAQQLRQANVTNDAQPGKLGFTQQ